MLLHMALFHSFYGWVIFHCINIPHLLYSFIWRWTFRLFHVLAITNSAAVSIGVHVYFWIMFFSRYMARSGIAGSYGSSIFSFLRNFHTVLIIGCYPFTSHLQVEGAQFSKIPSAFIFCRFCWWSVDWCKWKLFVD